MNLTNLITTISKGANNNTFASTEQLIVITGLIIIISIIDGSYTKDKDYSGYAVVFVKNNCILESISGCSYQILKCRMLLLN